MKKNNPFFDPDDWLKFVLVVTVPLTFLFTFLTVIVRDRALDPVVSGGMLALLGAIVALVTMKKDKDNDEPEV